MVVKALTTELWAGPMGRQGMGKLPENRGEEASTTPKAEGEGEHPLPEPERGPMHTGTRSQCPAS